MRAATQSPPMPMQPVTVRGKVYRRPPPASSLANLCAPSPSSASSSSSSSAASSRSSNSYGAGAPSRGTSGVAVSAPKRPTTTLVDDDSDLWASVRLASSPPKPAASSSYDQPPTTRMSTRVDHHRESSFAALLRSTGTPNQYKDDAAMLPLVIDDFSQARMGRVPTVKPPPPHAPPLAQQPKASSWSIGRRPQKADAAPSSPSPTPPFVRAHSVEGIVSTAPHDITLMDHRVFVARDQWVPHRDRRACVVCDRDFGLLVRKKHSCRMCGDVVCSRCSLFKNVKLPGVVGESKVRVCSRCFLQYRQRVLLAQTPTPHAHNPITANDAPATPPAQDDDHPHHQCDGHIEDQEPQHSTSGDEFAYDSQDELPSVEDVLRRTAAKVTGTRFGAASVSPLDLRRTTQTKPVSLLAPELMDAMYRESSTITATAAAAALRHQQQQHSANHIYGRGPSMVLLSPASSYDLLDMRLFDLEHTQSFSSTISTVSSSLSSSTASTSSSSRSVTEEELAAAIKARELEKEVEASRQRIQELECKMEEQENKKAELSLEQQKQLSEARELIAQLQEQLKQQEQNARDAAITRDSICLTNLRQMQHTQLPTPEPNGPRTQRSSSVEAESDALRQKLRLLERQLQQAGINVAEVIPFAVAKQRIIEISRRMAEISEAEAAMKTQNPKGVVALRREYYVLEQDMERFHTALLMSDEYIEEQAAKDREWEQGHAVANAQALRTVRSALPVDISRLTEQALRAMVTPSGKHMSADLARRFKRTNVLQLLRVPPQTIVRMHPSVIESYRTAGLTLIERRALHAALKAPASAWQQQARDEIAQKKHAWFKKLKDAFVQGLHAYEHHIVNHHMGDDAQCPFIGKMCVVRAEQAVALLYAAQLGFPEGDECLQQEIIKSDPEGAGEKALEEAKSQAQAAAQLSVRQTELKNHYGMRNVRLMTMAIATLEGMDAAMERLRALDAQADVLVRGASSLTEEGRATQTRWWRLCGDMVSEMRELALLLARRAGICLTGKRDPSKDTYDNRSSLEAQASHSALLYVDALADDLVATIASMAVPASATQLKNALPRIRELVMDVEDKNEALLFNGEPAPLRRSLTPVLEADSDDDSKSELGDEDDRVAPRRSCDVHQAVRVPWKEREMVDATTRTVAPTAATEVAKTAYEATRVDSSSVGRVPPMMPRGSILLDAIRAKRSGSPDGANESSDGARASMIVEAKVAPVIPVAEQPTPVAAVKKAVDAAPKANDLFAAIRAKRSAMVETVKENAAVEPTAAVAEPTPVASVMPTPVVVTEPVESVKPKEPEKANYEAPKATNLLAAIRARKAKANAVSAVASVDHHAGTSA